MQDNLSLYSLDYLPIPITVKDLKLFVNCVTLDLNCILSNVKIQYWKRSHWYRPFRYMDVFNGNFRSLVTALSNNASAVRKYILTFIDAWSRHTPECWVPHMTLTVRIHDYRGNPDYARITLSSIRCSKDDFALFQQIAADCLKIQIFPDMQHTFSDTLIKQNCDNALNNPILREQISSSIYSGKYDTALRTAFAILEDSLRQKCISAGRSEAKNQTTADLAVTAFHKDRGCLIPPWPVAIEAAQGAQLVFQGLFLYLRNAFIHNATIMGDDRTAVFECLMTIEFLLRVIEKSIIR